MNDTVRNLLDGHACVDADMPVLLRALRAKDRRPRRSGAQRFWVGDDIIRCLVYQSTDQPL